MIKLIYNTALTLYMGAMLPKIVVESLLRKKNNSHLIKRLGFGFPKIKRDGRPLVWIHAVSLGETKAIVPLVEQLDAQVIVSTVTQTGHAEGLKNVKADYHVYLPLDLPFIIRPIMRRVKPDALLLTETDFWFHFQDSAKREGAKLILINGKVSKRSFSRFSRFKALANLLIGAFDHYYLQGELYKERFLQLGIPEEKITVSGNIKLDNLKVERSLAPKEHFVITAGSTHDPEERIWMDAIEGLSVKLYLVPRHPERFDNVAALLQERGISFGRYSEQASFESCQVILVDAMGVLKQCYQYSHLAFVGGTFVERVGGHNLLEPSAFGVPVLYGPHVWGQPDLHELVTRYEAGCQVSEKELKEKVVALIEDKKGRVEMGERGKKIFSEAKGAICTVVLGVKSALC